MRAAKTIDQLYEEVKEYDYVITNDAPLATALNAKIDDFRLDGFAYTPRLLGAMLEVSILKEKTYTDLEIVERIEHETLADFRFIHSEVENIRDIRRYTYDVEKYLYSKRSKEIYESYRAIPTREKAMEIFEPQIYHTFMDGKKVAVIGIELFDDLDKHMLPSDFDEIDAYTDGEYEIGTIHAIGNDRQIAGSIVDLIDLETCNDTAIVLDSKSSVADAVRSALYRKDIPFKNSLDMKDLTQVRDYLQFLSLALDFETIRVGDVRELISVYQTGKNENRGRELVPENDNYLLCRFPIGEGTEKVTRRIVEAMRDVRSFTFGYMMDMVFDDMPQKTSVAILLDNMKLTDRKITPGLVNRLSYAVNNISDLKHNEQVPENEKKGVLLADCKNAVYVDRPFVIFIGLDESWEVTASGKDYVDKQKLDEDNAFRMGILLQQGTTRIYAVKPVTKGKETIPCNTFQTMYALDGMPRNISCFADICNEYVKGSWFRPAERERMSFGIMGEEFSRIRDWKFSKSSYNAYCDCPLKYMLSQVMPGEDNEYIVFGNCLHEFAEFYFCYPDAVREKGLDHYVARLDEMFAGMSNECQRELDVSRFRVYMNNIVKYIDLIRPEKVPLDSRVSDRKYPNRFMLEEGLEYCSSFTESKLSSEHPLFAKFDVCFGNMIADYKTGKPKDSKEITDSFNTGGKKLTETQALIYLQVLSEHVDGPCSFDLFFLGDNDIASVKEGFDIRENVRKVRLCTESLAELALGPNGTLRDDISDTKKYAPFHSAWDRVSPRLMEFADNNAFDTAYAVEQTVAAAGLKDGKGNRGAAEGLLKKVAALMSARYLRKGDSEVLIPSDSMREFVKELTEKHASADREMSVPIYDLRKGKIPCKDCAYSKVCVKANCDDEEEVTE